MKPFTAAAPTAAERWETAPASGRWVNKLRSLHIVDSGSVSERKEVLTPAAAQRGTADTLGEISQPRKGERCMTPRVPAPQSRLPEAECFPGARGEGGGNV